MNKVKAGLAGIVMALASIMAPAETEARNPQIQHSHNHNRQYWSNYNIRTFYGYPQFQQPWQRPQPIPQNPIIINTAPTISSSTPSNSNRVLFYEHESVYKVLEAGCPPIIGVIDKQGKIHGRLRIIPCPNGGNCTEGMRLLNEDYFCLPGGHYK